MGAFSLASWWQVGAVILVFAREVQPAPDRQRPSRKKNPVAETPGRWVSDRLWTLEELVERTSR
jgi:hypothetical protein